MQLSVKPNPFLISTTMFWPATLGIMRHAESKRNTLPKSGGFLCESPIEPAADWETEITDVGHHQAYRAGTGLAIMGARWDAVIVSPFTRVVQTLDGVRKGYQDAGADFPKEAVPSLFLRERDAAYNSNMGLAESKHVFPYLQPHWQREGAFLARPPGGESMAEVCERMYLFLTQQLLPRMQNKRVLIVCHGGTMRAIRYWLESWDIPRANHEFSTVIPPNCGYIEYRSHLDALSLGESGDPNSAYRTFS